MERRTTSSDLNDVEIVHTAFALLSLRSMIIIDEDETEFHFEQR